MHLGTPAVAILQGVTAMSVSPAPLLGSGSGLATPTCVSSSGSYCLYLLHHAKPEKGCASGTSIPETAFRVGVKSAGCFLGDELGCYWGTLH